MQQSMRRYILVLASFVFLMLTIFPHHHHVGGNICVTTKICPEDGRLNDEHTKKCHDFHVDRHHLFSTSIQKYRLASVVDNGSLGIGFFLCPSFWKDAFTYTLYVYTSSYLINKDNKRVLACFHGKHWKRRGPPFMG